MSVDFVDTNILAYAFDQSSPSKQEIARQILMGDFVISTQVLGELYVTLTRKLTTPMSVELAAEVISKLCIHTVVPITGDLVQVATRTSIRHQLSYWDALIIETAAWAGCPTIITEDLNNGASISGVLIKNPFTSTAH